MSILAIDGAVFGKNVAEAESKLEMGTGVHAPETKVKLGNQH